ncbi:MAG: type II toxin-antitoxin system VapC family toxin [Burkholderiaceae bacterium]|jgi:predicted nucleic acid-binding protein|nr:type II toxin-antitoxin system VapC family toxin [Gemmatimonadales bacterium]MCO5119276.1 type II toxin-antitoxin system VapC family toxin [Burkholderiaceae bacterium]MEB2317287.1 type II toxin-antitoxin system VapC family toxin [Pseudomonadota bacterium]
MSFIVDASVVLAWLLPDERSEKAEAVVSRMVADRAHAPSLLLLEVGNSLLHAQRRTRISAATHTDLLDAFTALPLMLEPITAETMLAARTLAQRHTLSLYDACYLDLALSRGMPLATLDRRLAAAASAEGLVLIGHP